MQVQQLGEFGLIRRLEAVVAEGQAACPANKIAPGYLLRLPIGDDTAAWDGPPGTRVLTTDTMVEGVHFDLRWIAWADLGWKLMAANLSDVAAMGCLPLYTVVTLGLRGDLPVDGLEEMYRGMLDACCPHGGTIVGGDVVRSPVTFVTVAMVGTAPADVGGTIRSEGRLLTRAEATEGDQVAVTGSLGCAAGGLRMYISELDFDGETVAHLGKAHDRPVPRVAEGVLLAKHGVRAAIDVSDGLVDDLRKLCEASGVGARVRADHVPVDATLKAAFPDDWLQLALTGGEDYELLFTAPAEVVAGVKSLLEVPVSVIGEVVDGDTGVAVIDQDGTPVDVERGGWDHFASD